MNAVICFKSALRTRSGLVLSSIFAAAAALWVSSCAPSYQSSMGGDQATYEKPLAASPSRPKAMASDVPSAVAARSTPDKVSESEAFAKPVKERPGLATQWGDSVKSPLGDTRFTRASTKPYGVDAIYYNDAEGLTAMGAKSYRIDAMQSAAGGIVEWGIRGSFATLPTYRSYANSRRYVEGRSGSTYSIVIKNCCKSRVQVVLSVDTHLDKPEARRVTFYTGRNNIFYLELAIDRTEFIKLHDFEANEVPDPDELIAQTNSKLADAAPAPEVDEHAELLKSLGM